ncbi:MAG: T9SS type A sorting domain-containing protein [Candidatus Latescibacteria bacterium]|nr:T9SS type A sorting domain-containing protein [Candidatus Latescibacterota bacterium]
MVDDVLERLFGVLGDPIAADPVPARTAFDGAYPNPFNPSTTLRFALAAPAHARLYVYDLAGRRVRSLVDAELPAAEHEAVWDGHDDRGTALPSGVYFARLTAGDFARSQKVLLLK